eukprot:2409051-Pyramimonas_sp.AAC.1
MASTAARRCVPAPSTRLDPLKHTGRALGLGCQAGLNAQLSMEAYRISQCIVVIKPTLTAPRPARGR